MKHLKQLDFNSFKQLDYIVITKLNQYSKEKDFIVGNIYQIDVKDKNSEEYRIHNEVNDMYVWVNIKEIRKALPYEIAALKYNI